VSSASLFQVFSKRPSNQLRHNYCQGAVSKSYLQFHTSKLSVKPLEDVHCYTQARMLALVIGIVDCVRANNNVLKPATSPQRRLLQRTWLWKIAKTLRSNLIRKGMHMFNLQTSRVAAEQGKKTSALQEHTFVVAPFLPATISQRCLSKYEDHC